MSGTYDSLIEIIEHIETDATFRAFCISTFGVAIDRGQDGNFSSRDVCRLTARIAEPEDWDQVTWNPPVHLFIVLPSQEILYDNACRSEVLATYHMIARFESPATVESIYNFVDELRDCLRRLDSTVSEPKWTNSGAEFFFTENNFPTARLIATVEHRQGEDD